MGSYLDSDFGMPLILTSGKKELSPSLLLKILRGVFDIDGSLGPKGVRFQYLGGLWNGSLSDASPGRGER